SLLLLVVGIGLYFLALPRRLFWAVVIVLALTVVFGALLWPSVVPAVVYGCIPGLAIFAVILAIQWMLQHRYRRQVIFMPGFRRMQTGSSLLRSGNSKRLRGEQPSTLDLPPAPASGSSNPPNSNGSGT